MSNKKILKKKSQNDKMIKDGRRSYIEFFKKIGGCNNARSC